jgi:PIN domain nuclease of toxin-antitoxin system
MNDVLADTHAIIWHLADPGQLSAPAATAMNAAEATGRIVIATITLVEMTYLVEKGKLDRAILDRLAIAVRDPAEPVEALPLSLDVVSILDQIPRGSVPDMPDRLIAATALAHHLPLVSADGKIRALSVSGLSVIW